MPTVQDWLRFYWSENTAIRVRAANVLLERAVDVSLDVLIEIFESLSCKGLGARAERALLQRRDKELVPKLIVMLQSKDHFVREVACNVLGQFGDKAATPHLLRMIDDPYVMVRRAAGFGLAFMKDPSSLAELKKQYERHRNDDSNVVMALQCALQSLGETCS
jgi:HEAT repeat protein